MTLKIISLNLLWGGYLFDNIVDFLKNENPDILCLQEVYNGKDKSLSNQYLSYSLLPKLLNYPYFAFAPTFINVLPIGNIEQGNAILSRFPIKTSRATFFDIPLQTMKIKSQKIFHKIPRNMLHGEIQINSRILNVYNVHGIWGEDGKDNDRRLKMTDTIVQTIQGKQNIILCGDFNMCPNTKSIDKIEQHLSYIFKNELTTTFNMKHKINGGYATAVVDLMFVSKNIKVISHSCPNVDVSDHLPLVAEVEI